MCEADKDMPVFPCMYDRSMDSYHKLMESYVRKEMIKKRNDKEKNKSKSEYI